MTTKRPDLTCRHPDRDVPKLMCGHPLPCPYHTAVLDMEADPPTVTIPITSQAIRQREQLGAIAEHLAGDEPPPGGEPYD